MLTNFLHRSVFQVVIRLARGGRSPSTFPPCPQVTKSSWPSFASACRTSPSLPEPRWTSTTALRGTAQRAGSSWDTSELIPVPWCPLPPGSCSTWRRCSAAGCRGGARHRGWRTRLRWESQRGSSILRPTGSWWRSTPGRTPTASECRRSSARQSTPSTSAWTGSRWRSARAPGWAAPGPRGTIAPGSRDVDYPGPLTLTSPPWRRRRRVPSVGRWTCWWTFRRSAGASGSFIQNATTLIAVRGAVLLQ